MAGVVLFGCRPAGAPTARLRTDGYAARRAPVLRVCADPNNLPFSDSLQRGFENRIARVIGSEIGATVEYTWWPQRRGFVRSTLNARRCDLAIGLPVADPQVLLTRPYYRSTYVFLSKRDRNFRLQTLDDPVLRHLRIGLHFIGDDYHNTPPAQALARRGLARQVTGYSIYGNYRLPSPPAELVHAVAAGAVDVAIIWGPFAGYFAPREPVAMTIAPLEDTVPLDPPFAFSIAAAVRRGDTVTRDRIQQALDRRHDEIAQVLREYGVPAARSDGATAVSRGSLQKGS